MRSDGQSQFRLMLRYQRIYHCIISIIVCIVNICSVNLYTVVLVVLRGICIAIIMPIIDSLRSVWLELRMAVSENHSVSGDISPSLALAQLTKVPYLGAFASFCRTSSFRHLALPRLFMICPPHRNQCVRTGQALKLRETDTRHYLRAVLIK